LGFLNAAPVVTASEVSVDDYPDIDIPRFEATTILSKSVTADRLAWVNIRIDFSVRGFVNESITAQILENTTVIDTATSGSNFRIDYDRTFLRKIPRGTTVYSVRVTTSGIDNTGSGIQTRSVVIYVRDESFYIIL